MGQRRRYLVLQACAIESGNRHTLLPLCYSAISITTAGVQRMLLAMLTSDDSAPFKAV